MGYFHSLAFPSKIIAEVEMHHSRERSRNGKKSVMTGDSPSRFATIYQGRGRFCREPIGWP
ncbi:MAG: hypothetical protein E5X53_21170 [Mesorhizobium sp.]|uniref:hypothetical protein n=1 Tax=Mesorhizobium sp. TaxID=1871066 RepID=UPI000FE98424|nr:hypothetical protein [Mesorhizobium sp.]RWM13580.1 MAG: hypothetical protein EOR73_28310 [Mesorhizobium sp.]TIP74957.1 MAG: hypothetical protein E5X55_06600 [Mesorhizobium sp.]TIQ09312.1 MAG: hypothetical protein E5X57_19585 [Mesorhizobium sp.]TIR50058.1 MAG: hypothetical protein E5X53_21170 [Mesorhizobium sp.]TJV96021.1 MAG: hypothetical protein E5X52_21300 [Mesorhizobium sp.]